MKKVTTLIALSVIMTALWLLTAGIGVSIFGVDVPNEASSYGLVFFFLTSLINTCVLYAIINNSKWRGWKLVGGIFVAIFGIQFFMPQMETIYFRDSVGMSLRFIFAIIFSGALLAISYSIIAVKMLGKWKKDLKLKSQKITFNTGYVTKLIFLGAIAYPVLYFCAGYFIAWQLPELRIYYSGSKIILPFFQHYILTFKTDPFFIPFQICRGFLWLAIAFIIKTSLNTSWQKKAIIVGLSFALLMNFQLIIPNPFMPTNIRLFHFIETASSNFIWGYVIVWLLEGNTKK